MEKERVMATFDLDQAMEVLERTPAVLETMLTGLSDKWTLADEGPGTWSPRAIIGHLILGEKTDWIPRMEMILSDQPVKDFVPFDMTSHMQYVRGKEVRELLQEFATLRAQNISILRNRNLAAEELAATGTHPEYGLVTLEQMLAAWVVHDLNHIAQIVRVMAKRYVKATGPWKNDMRILNK